MTVTTTWPFDLSHVIKVISRSTTLETLHNVAVLQFNLNVVIIKVFVETKKRTREAQPEKIKRTDPLLAKTR